jgi:hypothetical protein
VKFEHATGFKRDKNVATYSAKFHEGRYVIGQIAGKMTKSNTIGYVGAFPIPEVVAGINAFYLGAKSVNPNVKIKIVWANTWFDPGKEATPPRRCSIRAPTSSPSTPTARPRCSRRRHAANIAFGQASDMSKFAEKNILSSIIDDWAPYYVERTKAALDGKWEIEGHLRRHCQGQGQDGPLCQHARRREGDGGGDRAGDPRGQARSVQVPGGQAGRFDGRVQGRRQAVRRADHLDELLRQGHRRQAAEISTGRFCGDGALRRPVLLCSPTPG